MLLRATSAFLLILTVAILGGCGGGDSAPSIPHVFAGDFVGDLNLNNADRGGDPNAGPVVELTSMTVTQEGVVEGTAHIDSELGRETGAIIGTISRDGETVLSITFLSDTGAFHVSGNVSWHTDSSRGGPPKWVSGTVSVRQSYVTGPIDYPNSELIFWLK